MSVFLFSRAELTEQPPNASEFPYMDLLANLVIKERQKMQENPKNRSQFFYDMSAPVEEEQESYGRRGKRQFQGFSRFYLKTSDWLAGLHSSNCQLHSGKFCL